MNNPYSPPTSELTIDQESQGYKTLRWKILLFLLLPMEIWSQYSTFTVNEFGDSLIWRISSLLVYILYYVALFGLAFKRVYLNSKAWLYYLPLMIFFDFRGIHLLINNAPNENVNFTVVGLVIILPLVIVTWYSVYKYSKVLITELNKSSNTDE